MASIDLLWTRDDSFHYLKKRDPATDSYFKQGRRYRDLYAVRNFVKNYAVKRQIVRFEADEAISSACRSRLEFLLDKEIEGGLLIIK